MRKEDQNPPKDPYQPFINLHYDNAQKGENFMPVNSNNLKNPNNSLPNTIPSGPQYVKMAINEQHNALNSDERSKARERDPAEGMRQQEGRVANSDFDNRSIPYTN